MQLYKPWCILTDKKSLKMTFWFAFKFPPIWVIEWHTLSGWHRPNPPNRHLLGILEGLVEPYEKGKNKNTKLLVHETGKFQVFEFCSHPFNSNCSMWFEKFFQFRKNLDFFRSDIAATAQRHKHQPQTSTSEPSVVSRKSRIHTELHWDGPTSWQFGSHVETSAIERWMEKFQRFKIERRGRKNGNAGLVIYLNMIYHNVIVCM